MEPTPDTRLNAVLAELEALKETRDDLWNVSWDAGKFLRILVLSTGAKNVLEIGMSNGFSTLWLADAARANGGSVTSLEVEPYKVEMATATFEKAGLSENITVHLGDGKETLASLQGPYDFVFLDAWKGDYITYLRTVTPLLKQGGLIAADNAVSHAEDMVDYLAAVRDESHYDSVLVPLGNGLELSRKR
jgi:caffeoyl-CoA O-methyltransferase